MEHFYMSSASNGEVIIPDLLHDPTMPLIGKSVAASVQCHAAIAAAIACGYAVRELPRTRRQRLSSRGGGASGGASGGACHGVYAETAAKTFVVTCWYFWLPCAIAFQCVLLVIDAVHMWGDLAFEDAMSAPCEAKNNAFLLLPLLGENWHNNHHSTPVRMQRH